MSAAAAAPAWAGLIERLVRGLERGSREWTVARRKDSLQRLLAGSRSDAERLQQRLQSLLAAWEGDGSAAAIEPAGASPVPAPGGAPADAATGASADAQTDAPGHSPINAPTNAPAKSPINAPAEAPANAPADAQIATSSECWPPLAASLGGALQAALPPGDAHAGELADRLARLAERIAAQGADAAVVREVEAACAEARRHFTHRHHLVDELARLCRELTGGLVELAEDDSWVRGQCENLHARLAGGLNARSLRAAGDLLQQTRQRQQQLHGERNAARDALKTLVQRLLQEVGELDAQTGRFEQTVGRHAEAIGRADTLAGVTAVVRELLDESHAVQALVHGARQRLAGEHAKATELERRVRELEGELRRLSDEVTTDALTQVANRRGLAQAFEAECARMAASGGAGAPPLAVALIDIDNFKKLNDTLGHAAGDRALQGLAAAVRERLRPTDHLARFGGEEFVVLLPASLAPEAQQALTRLQRSLTESLFLHEGREVFVTFSAGVTAWRSGETLEAALERADEALYEAKRTGKNRTCIA